MMINDLPLDIFGVIATYSCETDFHYLLNTNKQSFQHIKKRLIVLNLNEAKSEGYLTNISFRERVLSVVENGWKQVNVHVVEGHRDQSTLPPDIPVHAMFIRPKKTKRAPSPYIIFCSEKRPELRAAHPHATFGEMGKMLGQMWAQMDEKAKKVNIIDSWSNSLPLLMLCVLYILNIGLCSQTLS